MGKYQKRSVLRMLQFALATTAASARGSAATFTWDSSGSHPTQPTDGGGTWNLTTADWSNGTTDAAWFNSSTSTAVFGTGHGAAGVVNLGASIAAGGITFNPAGSGNYNIAGNNSISFPNSPIITVNGSASPVISASISAPGILTVNGTGTLTLQGTDRQYRFF